MKGAPKWTDTCRIFLHCKKMYPLIGKKSYLDDFSRLTRPLNTPFSSICYYVIFLGYNRMFRWYFWQCSPFLEYVRSMHMKGGGREKLHLLEFFAHPSTKRGSNVTQKLSVIQAFRRQGHKWSRGSITAKWNKPAWREQQGSLCCIVLKWLIVGKNFMKIVCIFAITFLPTDRCKKA